MARGRKPKVVEKHEGSGLDPAPEAPAEKAKSPYQDHMAGWESKSEKAAAEKSSQDSLDYQNHPKFHKFKKGE